jgi:hypothetical protein
MRVGGSSGRGRCNVSILDQANLAQTLAKHSRSLLAGRLAREARGAIETHGSVEFALQIAVAGVHDYRDADAIGQRT